MEVHRSLGPGLHEKTYQEALQVEFDHRGIPYRRESRVAVAYRDRILATSRFADFVCFDSVVVELKVAESICAEHISQALHYMRATSLPTGLILKFKNASLEFRRLIWAPRDRDHEAASTSARTPI